MNKEPIILINSGDFFEGTIEQFEDCFFALLGHFFSESSTTEERLSEIETFCKNEDMTFSWSYELTPYKKADGSTWLGNQMIFTGSQEN